MRIKRRITLVCRTDSRNESVTFEDGTTRIFTNLRMRTTPTTQRIKSKHNENSWEDLVQKWRGYIKTQDEN